MNQDALMTTLKALKLYGMAGVSAEAATAGALLHRASYYAVIVVAGGLSLGGILAVSRRGTVEESAVTPPTAAGPPAS